MNVCFAAAAATEESRQIASLGPDLWNRTYYPTKEDADSLKKPWYVVDAEGQTLGRLAVLVADHIRCAYLMHGQTVRTAAKIECSYILSAAGCGSKGPLQWLLVYSTLCGPQ